MTSLADALGVDGSGYIAATYATSPDADRPVMEAIRALTEAELVSAARGRREPRLGPHDRLAALALRDWELAGRMGPGDARGWAEFFGHARIAALLSG